METTKARLDRIPETLKRFRQSVLAAAVSGRLIEEWHGKNGLNLADWIQMNIGQLAEVATGTTPKRTNESFWENGSIPWLTSASTGESFTYEAKQFVTMFAVKECTLKMFQRGLCY